MTYKLLSIVVDKELLQLEAPVMASFEDSVVEHRLTHVAAPGVQVASTVRRPGTHQDIQTVHTETSARTHDNSQNVAHPLLCGSHFSVSHSYLSD